MRYDDRLATVLRLNVTSRTVARIQYNQLIDLLGTCPAEARCELLDQAYVRLAGLSAQIPAGERAGMLAAPGLRLRTPRLVAELACAEPQVAFAAVRAAALSEEQWLDLIPALPPGARGAMRARGDFGDRARALLARLGVGDHALPEVAETVTATAPAGKSDADTASTVIAMPSRALPATPEHTSGIGAIVERIEALRRSREADAAETLADLAAGADQLPQLPLGDAEMHSTPRLAAIDFATDTAGRVTWSERSAAPMLVGLNLAEFDGLGLTIRQRLPIRAAALALDGASAISGDWQADAMPQFDAQGGRFTGYLGRLRRMVAAQVDQAPSPAAREADVLRQVLHELRTPVNAIQGFAEIIQHQLYGPTPHEYRALSAVIVADAARMLAGFEELERLARLGSGAMELAAGECDFANVVRDAAARLIPHAQAHGFTLGLHDAGTELPVALAPIEAERLCWRLLATLAGNTEPGGALELVLETREGTLNLALSLPEQLAVLDDRALFSGDTALEGAAGNGLLGGSFGSGFALRLARVEARAAGGTLSRNKEKLNLSLPLLTRMVVGHSVSDPRGLDRNGAPAG